MSLPVAFYFDVDGLECGTGDDTTKSKSSDEGTQDNLASAGPEIRHGGSVSTVSIDDLVDQDSGRHLATFGDYLELVKQIHGEAAAAESSSSHSAPQQRISPHALPETTTNRGGDDEVADRGADDRESPLRSGSDRGSLQPQMEGGDEPMTSSFAVGAAAPPARPSPPVEASAPPLAMPSPSSLRLLNEWAAAAPTADAEASGCASSSFARDAAAASTTAGRPRERPLSLSHRGSVRPDTAAAPIIDPVGVPTADVSTAAVRTWLARMDEVRANFMMDIDDHGNGGNDNPNSGDGDSGGGGGHDHADDGGGGGHGHADARSLMSAPRAARRGSGRYGGAPRDENEYTATEEEEGERALRARSANGSQLLAVGCSEARSIIW